MTKRSDEFQDIRQFLATGGTSPSLWDSGDFVVPCHRRLIDALRGSTAAPADLAALVRHVLRREMVKQGGLAQTVRVPQTERWPTAQIWHRHGMKTRLHSSGDLIVEAVPWTPNWLTLADRICPESDAFGETLRRQPDPREGDPFLEKQGYSMYLTEGQRHAVRAVLTAPQGSTLVVNLPTGTGKSLCAHVLAKVPFVSDDSDGVTIVVVPTTALALDQERVVEWICYPTAFRAATSDEIEERNRQIQRSIYEGNQPIVFTSPESLTGGLRSAVYAAAERGSIKAIVVDEAHMVDQWGDEFRSAFQQIAGLRRALLRVCPSSKFRTLLLSATLTDSSLETLRSLFGQPGPMEIVSSVQLRPEPTYWISRCDSTSEKTQQVLEALYHLPRPLILYTTIIDDAVHWHRVLRDAGYRRLDVMTGNTGTLQRERIISKWAHANIDIVVATSAFGLGVDNREVRTVIHACIPETLDRFYQEVGRGGRDGNASVSLVVYTQQDLETASSLNSNRVITLEKGLPRWRRMFSDKTMLAPDNMRIKVPVDVAPSYNYDLAGVKNTEWNVRTLTLMNRAGIIELDDEAPPRVSQQNIDNKDETPNVTVLNPHTQKQSRPECVVSLLHTDHLRKELWHSLVEPLRKVESRSRRKQLRLLKNVLEEKQCIGGTLAQAYTLKAAKEKETQHEVLVEPSCGGCGYCRAKGILPYSARADVTRPQWDSHTLIGNRLAKYLSGSSVLCLFFSSTESTRNQWRAFRRLLPWLIHEGIRCLIGSKELTLFLLNQERRIADLAVMVERKYSPQDNPRVPTTLIYTDGDLPRDLPAWEERARERDSRQAPLVLVLPDNARDPRRPDRSASSILPCPCMPLNELLIREVL